jgi:hypothetical protein
LIFCLAPAGSIAKNSYQLFFLRSALDRRDETLNYIPFKSALWIAAAPNAKVFDILRRK